MTSALGDQIQLPAPGVTCVVGPNNSGKTRLLKDLVAMLSGFHPAPVTLTTAELVKVPRALDASVEAWLGSTARKRDEHQGRAPTFSPFGGGGEMAVDEFVSAWNHQPYLRGIFGYFGWHATAASLVGHASQEVSPPMGGGTPLSRVFGEGEIDEAMSRLSDRVFGFPLTFDRTSGHFRYRVGRPPVPAPPVDRPTREYTDGVLSLPKLADQGDGVKSFMGLAINVIAGNAQILLVDEPEAFLHPAQARELGRWLGVEAAETGKQIVAATHDRDFLLGLLDSRSPLTVVRITRHNGGTRLQQVPAEDVQDLWNDPVLRYSNVLQGLFHRRVVVCESDADCRFYRALLESICEESGNTALGYDTLFIPAGGKDRVAALARAIASIGGDAHAIVDFDVLDKASTVREIVSATGGEWTEAMSEAYKHLLDAVNSDNDLRQRLKQSGLAAIPRGRVSANTSMLLDWLRERGVHVVPAGEMEGFDRSVDHSKGAWVSEMLQRGNHHSNTDARDFMRPLAE
ncbi:MAG: AAA family ATPase [Bifidobacteriaceae bacterium]|nr:AAA family ATPase [Bifidobacteriaceae bacterium]